MANQQQLDILNLGAEAWNLWRNKNPTIRPDLSGADLSQTVYFNDFLDKTKLREPYIHVEDIIKVALNKEDFSLSAYTKLNSLLISLSQVGKNTLSKAVLGEGSLSLANLTDIPHLLAGLSAATLNGVVLRRANLSRINLSGADLRETNFSIANLNVADLSKSNLKGANLSSTDLVLANLNEADLSEADLSGANLSGSFLRETNLNNANLNGANLSGADLSKADLTGCSIYGTSAWNVELRETIQSNLIITRPEESTITVDNLEVAQFIYLLLNNNKIRDVIDTITSKVVLILGRFTPERKTILDALRNELRKKNYLPVLFDFDKPADRDLTETVSILAHLARFIIVDLTDPSSVPHEVVAVIPHTVVPVQPLLTLQPLIVEGKAVERHEYAMFEDLRRRYDWVLPTFRYQDTADLLASLQEHIVEPAEQKARELAKR